MLLLIVSKVEEKKNNQEAAGRVSRQPQDREPEVGREWGDHV